MKSLHSRWILSALAAYALLLLNAPISRADAPANDFFTIIVMPDTQYYTEVQWKTDEYFKAQTTWIVANRAKEHIVFVSHVGDLQQDGTYLRLEKQPDPEQAKLVADATPDNPPQNDRQWQRASDAMEILDKADIPYVAVAGNHDFQHWGTIRDPIKYLKYFGPDRFYGKSWFGGYSPASAKMPPGVNTYQTFNAAGQTFLSIGLRFAPDDDDVAWAQKVIDAHRGLPTIISTHAYVTNKGFDKDRRNIWEKLVRKNPQIFLTLNGHENGHNYVVEKDDAGLDVHEILVDYQDFAFEGYAHGGGYLRLMRFDPAKNSVEVTTYSPVMKRFMEDPKDHFTIRLNFAERFATRAAGTASQPASAAASAPAAAPAAAAQPAR